MTSLAICDETLTANASIASKSVRFKQQIEVHLLDLHRYALWLTKDQNVSEDLVQETLLRAWRSLDKLKNPKVAKSWLITILRRENARRFERYQPTISAIPTEDLRDPYCYNDTSTKAFALRQALDELPGDYRDPLLLQVVHGYSQKEIAAHLGISVAGACTRLFRARQKLRKMLGDPE